MPTHVNDWFPAVYMRIMSQNFCLFHVSNLSVPNFLFFSAHVSGVNIAASLERGHKSFKIVPTAGTGEGRVWMGHRRRRRRGGTLIVAKLEHRTVRPGPEGDVRSMDELYLPGFSTARAELRPDSCQGEAEAGL